MRTKNTEKYEKYQTAFALMQERNPGLTRTGVIQKMHEISGKPVATIRYYIKPEYDLRIKYTPEDMRALLQMSKPELQAEADRRKIGLASLQTIIANHLNFTKKGNRGRLIVAARTKIHLDNFMDFDDGIHLGAINLSRRVVAFTRKMLWEKWKLKIEGRYLIQSSLKRRIALDLSEQVIILTDTEEYVKQNAAALGQRWETMGD
jgi:hypothetical protein